MRLTLLFLLLFADVLTSSAQQAVPDSTFGTNGIVVDNEDSVRMNSNRMVVQPDGKIIVAGSYFYYLYPQSFDLVWEMSLMRFKPDGSRDSSFNGTGNVKKILEHGTRIAALVLQPDGRMLITFNNGTLFRYLPTGKLDSSFNDSGEVKLPYLLTYDYTSGTAIQPDGKILITGNVINSYMLLTRLNQDGRPDSTFGRYGMRNVIIDSVSRMVGSALSVQPDGKIVAVGGSDKGMVVMRFLTDGSTDGSFGGGKGYLRASFPELTNSSASLLSLLPTGKMMIGGTGWRHDHNNTWWVVSWLGRVSTSGYFDSSFNGTGRAIIDSTVYPASFPFLPSPSIAVQPDGKVLMSAMAGTELFNKHFSLNRINPNGSRDNTFGIGGQIVTALSNKNDYPWDVAVLPDKKILLCGVSNWDTAWPQSRYSAPSVVRYKTIVLPDVPPVDTATAEFIHLYPNPTPNDFLSIRYRLDESTTLDVQLWNTVGQVIQRWTIPSATAETIHKEQLALPASLARANYIVRIVTNSLQRTIVIVKE
jgi:uncharacterized delta-60 repeat protein